MPIYEYRCRDCGEALEVRQAFTDDALTECPHCKGSLRKIFSTPGISFKGSGFYKTDSRSGGSGSSSTSTWIVWPLSMIRVESRKISSTSA